MGVRILSIDGSGKTCLFDSVTDWAFGPVTEEDTILEFLKWCSETNQDDLRVCPQDELFARWNAFLEQFTEEHDERSNVATE